MSRLNGKDSSPLVSFIIPSFNSAGYLKYCIDSCIEQTYQNIEIIIIDDGSTDTTSDIIDLYKSNSNLTCVRNNTNKGLIYSLNRGICLAKGELLARMDADDICLSTRIYEQVNFLNNNPDISVVGSDILMIDKYGKIIGRPRRFLAGFDEIEWSVINSCPLYHPTALFRKKILNGEQIYHTEECFAEDLGLWARLILNQKKIAIINKPLVFYRKHSSSLSNTFKIENLKAQIRISQSFAMAKWRLNLSEKFIEKLRKRTGLDDKEFFKEAKEIIHSMDAFGYAGTASVVRMDIQHVCLETLHLFSLRSDQNLISAIINSLLFLVSAENIKLFPGAIFRFYCGLYRRFSYLVYKFLNETFRIDLNVTSDK